MWQKITLVGFLQDLLAFLDEQKYGELATIVGRYYAMDRDKRWERIKVSKNYMIICYLMNYLLSSIITIFTINNNNIRLPMRR